MTEQMTENIINITKEDAEFIRLLANYIKVLKERNQLSNEAIADMCGVSASTVKNICAGKIDNPGICIARRMIYLMGGSFDEMLNPGKTKEDLKGVSVAALKEMYEFQIMERDKINEKHIAEIRSHYEQHRADVTENYEKRLADKRELLESYKEHISSMKIEIKWLKVACLVMFAIFAGLCVAELMNPNIGWVRF